MESKKFYQSKLFWVGILTALLGVFPLLNTYIQVIAPQAVVPVEATGAFVAGIITIILRIWFTNTSIS